MVYLPYLRLAAGLAALAALASRAAGTSLTELLAERVGMVYPAERPTGLLDKLRERLGLTPAPEAPKENPVEQLRREIEASDLSPETKRQLLLKLKRGDYSGALEGYRYALAAPLKL